MLVNGANTKVKGANRKTALYKAIGGYKSLVRLLLKKGANINLKDYYRDIALYRATYNRHNIVIQLLL